MFGKPRHERKKEGHSTASLLNAGLLLLSPFCCSVSWGDSGLGGGIPCSSDAVSMRCLCVSPCLLPPHSPWCLELPPQSQGPDKIHDHWTDPSLQPWSNVRWREFKLLTRDISAGLYSQGISRSWSYWEKKSVHICVFLVLRNLVMHVTILQTEPGQPRRAVGLGPSWKHS